jgi:hypothetical protein
VIVKNSGAYDLVPYSFGHGARATGFNELMSNQWIAIRLLMHKIYAETKHGLITSYS